MESDDRSSSDFVLDNMHLKTLELSGFKSFAKKAMLNFNTPITAIVGPNGSGKSNTAEAFRFVLGEQSIKSLRGKRGEDMIWNGALGTTRANRASVKLTFDNSRRLFPTIDFDEVTLERVVNRDNTNEYLLNGSQVRLKDIVEILGSAHIGATGHHIISQGEADRILSASIRERREMIEDALGLKVYQWKKAESLRKLERTEENMKQVESLRREIAPHLRFLKKQCEKVEKAEEMRRELVGLYKAYFSDEECRLRVEKEAIGAELSGPKAEMARLEDELEKAKKVLTQAKGRDDRTREVIRLEEHLKAERTKKDGVMREIGRIEGEINAERRAIEKEEARIKSEEYRTVYVKDVEEVVRTIEGFGSIGDAAKLFSEVMAALKSFIAKHRTISHSELVDDAKDEIDALSKKRAGLEKDLVELDAREKKLQVEYDEIKGSIEREKDTNREAEKDVFRIIARQNELRGTISTLEARLNANSRQEEEFRHELGEAGIVAGREAVEYEKGRNGDELPGNISSIQDERRKKIERNKIRLEDSGGFGGQEVLKEFRETEERDSFLAKELGDLERAKKELATLITELDVRIDTEFKSGILKINAEFQKYFELMFGGGKAELAVVKEVRRKKKSDVEDLSSALAAGDGYSDGEAQEGEEGENMEEGPEGLEVNVSLPKKKVKGLMMLSGGERALTSIALLFAVSQVNPPPFIILDETDAALDEANSKKYGDMIDDLSKHSQLILITHNRETMSRAGVLYGVTMGADGASRLLSLAFEEAVAVAK